MKDTRAAGLAWAARKARQAARAWRIAPNAHGESQSEALIYLARWAERTARKLERER